jgi:glycosyltransferase involved in cell wall biosynthesis
MSQPAEKISVCIVSHNCYGAVRGGNTGFIGGVERQTSLLAWWLVERGHEVSLLTWDEGGGAEERIRGVRVIKICRQQAGLPGLRFFHPKWSGLNRAMARADAQVYYHNFSECVTGQMALWCRWHGRGFVFSAASDADCDPALPELHSYRERVLYRYGVRHADRVIVQTLNQQRRMRDLFGLESTVIPMPCPVPSAPLADRPEQGQVRVLWIGRVCEVKRPDRLLDLAEQCPQAAFDLVGPFYQDGYCPAIKERACRVPNVSIHGAVPRDRMSEFYQRASLLCCTSDYEGFPNTFLEAWSHGVPVVSTVDPDGVIARRNLGRHCADPAELAKAMTELLRSPEEYREVSANARRYFLETHTPEAVMPRVESVLVQAARGGRRGQ